MGLGEVKDDEDILFFNSFAFWQTRCCKLRSFGSSSEKPVPLMTIGSVIFRASGAAAYSFAAFSTQGSLFGGIWGADRGGVFAKIIITMKGLCVTIQFREL